MSEHVDTLKILSEDECWNLLRGDVLGRLVTNAGGIVDLTPVNYVVDEGTIVIRTAEGQKYAGLTVNHEVLFEIDDYTDEVGWSVIVRGKAKRVTSTEEIMRCDELDLRPMAPTLKLNYVRITADSVSGREFRRGPEPDREAVQLG